MPSGLPSASAFHLLLAMPSAMPSALCAALPSAMPFGLCHPCPLGKPLVKQLHIMAVFVTRCDKANCTFDRMMD